MATCESCDRRISGTVYHSVTGRELCRSCHDRLLGRTAGVLAGGSSTGDQIRSAAAVEGWFSRLRRRRKGSGSADD